MPGAEAGPRLLDAAAVAARLPYPRLIEALRDGFRNPAAAPVRHHHRFPRRHATAGDLLLMPAWDTSADGGGGLGVKLVTVCPGNETRGLASVQALYVLFDGETGKPRAVLDGGVLTLRRTACASALAADHLARRDARHLLLIGAGALAPHLARAHRAVRGIERVSVWNRTAARAEALADALRREGIAATATRDLPGALAEADVVSAATMSTEPLIAGDLLAEGCHLDLVGGYRPDMREADDAAVLRSQVFVDTRGGALAEAGDIVGAIESGALTPDGIRADLSELCRGVHPGRTDRAAVTLFKSVGTALEDLVAARLAVDGPAGDGGSGNGGGRA